MTLGITDDSNYTNIANAIRDMSAGDTDGLTLAPSEMSGAIRGLRSVWGNIEGTLSDQIDLNSALNAKQNTLTFDNTPTANSNNPVKSGGIKTALDAKQDTLIKSVSGPIVSFSDGVAAPAGNVTVAIEPVQEGSGDPSPDNVRPITGWTGVKVCRTGINIWDEEWELGSIGDRGEDFYTPNYIRSKNYISVKPNKTYYVKSPSGLYIWGYNANKEYVKRVPNAGLVTNTVLTIPDGIYFIRFRPENSYGTTYNNDISINYPSTDTDYHAFTGDTYDISFGEAGTVYGGSLDVTSGKLTVTHVLYTFDGSEDEQWTLGNHSVRYEFNLINSVKFKTYKSGGRGLSNIGKYESNAYTDDYDYITSRSTVGENANGSSVHVLVIPPSIATTVSELRTFLSNNPEQWYAPLQTPLTYQLTPTQVTTLLGKNRIWADTGDVDVSYWRDEAVGKSVPSAASVYKALLDIDDLGMKRYGVSGVGESASTLTRIYDAVGMVAQVGTDGDNSAVRNDFDHALPFMRRKCVGSWTLEGEQAVFHVAAYYGDEGYTEDGSIGDYVAVECPRCYYLREGDKLVVSAHQYPGYRPFDIFCKNHNPQDTMPFAYLPAYALAMKDGKAVSLPGLDNEQGCYYDMVTRARTYADGEVGTKAMILPFAVNFYEYCLSTIEFAEQNPENILKGCTSLRHDNNDTCTFIDTTHVLVNNWQTARVVGEYVAIIGATEDRNLASRQATHRIKSITRCDSSGNASSSGSYTKIEVENLGKNYFNYDTSTTYRFVARPWRTGETNSVSTPSGSPVNNTNGYYPMKYRWRENVWGNQWTTSMDLFNIKEGTSDSDWTLDWYFLPDPEEYTPSASSKPDAAELKAESPFVKLSLTTPHANYKDGYIKSKKFSGLYPDVWIPNETTGASATTYYADYAYLVTSHSVRSVRFGGNWYNGASAGSSAFAGNAAPSHSYASYGAHLYMRQG